MYYYRVQEEEWDGDNYFFYLEHTKSFTPKQFFRHFMTVYNEWFDHHPQRLEFLFRSQPDLVIEYLQELLSLLKKRYGYKSLNVEQTAEYVTEMEVFADDSYDYVETLKHTGFQPHHFFEEGYVNLEYEYRMLVDRKLRKRGKASLVEKDKYVFRLKEAHNSMIYTYPLTHTIRLSQDSFFAHVEEVRKQLMAEKGIKPLIGIDLANRLCADFGYEPLYVNSTLTCFHFSEKQNKAGNELGLTSSHTGTLQFEQDYPERRDLDEDYLIEGDALLLYRYFSCVAVQNQPLLVQVDGKWYAYHEARQGNYAPTLPNENLKVISITVEFFDDYTICSSEDDLYATRIQEAIANSLALNEPLKNYS